VTTNIETKERGIRFSAPMVQALLAGRKTQTRRIIKAAGRQAEWLTPELLHSVPKLTVMREHEGDGYGPLGAQMDHPKGGPLGFVRCPYGQPGDRLIVREAWRTEARYDDLKPSDVPGDARIWYEADGDTRWSPGKLRPSLFMPRWASRITLEITDVRVERVNEISEDDALAEGIEELEQGPPMERFWAPDGDDGHHCAVHAYAELWDSINGKKHPWASNPWVWVVGFKKVEAAK
jgi:hypothetical protein